MRLGTFLLLLPALSLLSSGWTAHAAQTNRPTLFIIGDSTVKNGTKGQRGWGEEIAAHFDPGQVVVANHAIGGRSSRTFLTEGRWAKVQSALQPGDFVLIQFGHNDSGALDDKQRARGTIRGTGAESREIDNPITQRKELVHSYGWYLRKYVQEAKAAGATPVLCSPVPRNIRKEGRVARATNDYGKWAAEIARSEQVAFLDLNELIARRYENLGADKVQALFHGDHTHTSPQGARVNAGVVVEGLKALPGNPLRPRWQNEPAPKQPSAEKPPAR